MQKSTWRLNIKRTLDAFFFFPFFVPKIPQSCAKVVSMPHLLCLVVLNSPHAFLEQNFPPLLLVFKSCSVSALCRLFALTYTIWHNWSRRKICLAPSFISLRGHLLSFLDAPISMWRLGACRQHCSRRSPSLWRLGRTEPVQSWLSSSLSTFVWAGGSQAGISV